jgi:hypothetical protein
VIGVPLLIGLAVTLAPLADDLLPEAALLQRAESAFRQGRECRSTPSQARVCFARAAAVYDQLRQRGFHSAALFANQGNAYFLAGDWPRAILAYRRGLRLAPGNRSLRSNLTRARAQVDHPLSVTGDRLPWLPRLAPRWQWIVFIGLYGLGCLSFTRWWMVRRPWLVRAGISAFLSALALAGGVGLAETERRQDLAHPLVVIAKDQVKLRKGNGNRYTPADERPLSRGVEARWLFTRGDWFQIELADGKVGWVPVADALLDKP